MKLAFVTPGTTPAVAPIPSGGAIPTTAIGFGASDDLGFTRYVYENDVAGDIDAQMPQVADAQARLAAVILGDGYARDMWKDPANINFSKNLPYFALQNPGGVLVPSAGVGAPPTRRELLCLRRRIEPHGAQARIVYVMNTEMLDALDRTTYEDGYPLDWTEDIEGVARPHLSGIPIVISDHIAAVEPSGGSSIYAIRLPDPSDAFGTDGVHLVASPGEEGVQVFPANPKAGVDVHQFRAQLSWMLVSGSRSSVARGSGFGV